MQSNVENLGALERRIELAISQKQIQTEVDKRLKGLAKKTKMHGFRPGKVPLKLVSQRYGAQVHQEVIGDALQKEFAGAIKENDLKVVGYPRYEAKDGAGSDDSTQLRFSATFEVFPKIVLGDLSQVKIEKPVTAIGPEDIDKTMEMIRRQHIQYQPVTDRAVETDDRVTIDYRGTLDGEDFEGGQAENAQLSVGRGKFMKDFEDALIGMSSDEEKSFKVTFPDDYHGKDVAGKTVTFTVKLKLIELPVLPEIDADFAKRLGITDGDIDKMREAIHHDLEREVARQIRSKLKAQAMSSLMDTNPIDAPTALIDQEIERLMEDAREDFASRGLSANAVQLKPEMFKNKAEERIKLGLILAELMNAHQLKATPEQVRGVIEEAAKAYEHPEEVIKWHYASKERLQDAESLALEENVVNWILQQVEVVEKAVTFDELMGIA